MESSTIRKTAWAVAVLGVLGAGGYSMRNRLLPALSETAVTPAAERPAQPVRVTRVTFASLAAAEVYTGTVRPHHEALLAFRQPGKMIARLVDVGDKVAAGQTVARLDDTDARLEHDAANAEVVAARTDLVRAESAMLRTRDLFADGHVAQAALDLATSATAEARSRVDRAESTLTLARNRLSYMGLEAEADGIVTATWAEPGQVVGAAQAVVSVAQTAEPDVVFALPEQSRAVLEGAVATAELWGASGKVYALALRDISPDVDPAGRTYRVRMAIAAPDADVAFGRTATVRLATAGEQPVTILPLAAVLNEGHGPFVWRLAAGTGRVERIPVDLVTAAGDVAHLRGGLADGELVVSLGAQKIDPDRPVRVVETAAAPES